MTTNVRKLILVCVEIRKDFLEEMSLELRCDKQGVSNLVGMENKAL